MRGTYRSLTLAAQAESLSRFTEFVRKGAREAGLPESRMGELDLLIEEILTNIARYAYPLSVPGIVTVTCSVPGPGELTVEVADQGIEFDPLTMDPPDLTSDLAIRPVGGLGIFLLKTLAESLTYRREDGWNRLTLGLRKARD